MVGSYVRSHVNWMMLKNKETPSCQSNQNFCIVLFLSACIMPFKISTPISTHLGYAGILLMDRKTSNLQAFYFVYGRVASSNVLG